MKFNYSLKQKTKIALLLFLIMACTILIRLLEDRSIKNMEKSVSSLYNDRLIPAADIFFISEKIYAKHFLIEGFVYNDLNLNANEITQKLTKLDLEIDSLLLKYEKTFLVKNEKSELNNLKIKLIENKALEKNILANSASVDKLTLQKIHMNSAQNSFNDIGTVLSQLTKIQTAVGTELQNESHKIVEGTKVYSNLQLILAIIIGILIVSILFASKVVNVKSEKFNLN